jgi:hypothetical protein
MPRLGWTLHMTAATLLLAPVIAWAQAAPPDSAALAEARQRLAGDLRNLITAQESFFAEHETYASTMARLESRHRPSQGVTVVLLTSSGTGHSEIALDKRVPGLVCGTFVGNAPPPFGRGREAEIVCHGP